MRLSETGMLHEQSTGLKPSVAFKFLRDGIKSDNVVAMPSFSGSGSWNFLENPMHSRVEAFEEGSCADMTIRKKLVEGSKWPFSCGIGHIGRHNADGSDTDSVNIPYQLSFETAGNLASKFSSEKGDEMWYDQLKSEISTGTTLFNVNALTAPPGLSESRLVKIGTIELLTPLYTSVAGDNRLFFEHEGTG